MSRSLTARAPEPDPVLEREDPLKKVRPGTWWRRNAEPNAVWSRVPEGQVLLAEKVDELDGVPHAVSLRMHPEAEGKGNPSWRKSRADELLKAFDPAPDAERVRAAEMQAIEGRIEEERKALERTRARIGAEPSLETGPRKGQALGLHAGLARLEGWRTALTERSERIQALTAKLTPYVEERLAAAKAAHAPVLGEVKELDQRMDLVRLFTGEGVTTKRIRDGQGAAPEEPLVLYQGILNVDEESLINVLNGEGGADCRDIGRYLKHLETRPEAVERILPMRRSVVGMRARREAKEYESVLEVMEYASANQEVFLLVRDGDRLTLVDGPFGQPEKLFPGEHDRREAFERIRGAIGAEHVDYALAAGEVQKMRLRYWRHLVILAGAQLRERIAGQFAEEEETGEPLSILAPGMHERCVRYVYDAEGGDALEEQGPGPFQEYQRRQNAKARPGERAVVHWPTLIDIETCPEWYSAWDRRRYRDGRDVGWQKPAWKPKSRTPEIVRIKPKPQGGWQASCKLANGRSKMVPLDTWGGWLRLTDVEMEDLRWYARSRTARRSYLQVIPMVVPGLRQLKAERNEDAAKLKEWGIDDPNGPEAMRAWREVLDRKATKTAIRRLAEQIGEARELQPNNRERYIAGVRGEVVRARGPVEGPLRLPWAEVEAWGAGETGATAGWPAGRTVRRGADDTLAMRSLDLEMERAQALEALGAASQERWLGWLTELREKPSMLDVWLRHIAYVLSKDRTRYVPTVWLHVPAGVVRTADGSERRILRMETEAWTVAYRVADDPGRIDQALARHYQTPKPTQESQKRKAGDPWRKHAWWSAMRIRAKLPGPGPATVIGDDGGRMQWPASKIWRTPDGAELLVVKPAETYTSWPDGKHRTTEKRITRMDLLTTPPEGEGLQIPIYEEDEGDEEE